ncbi:MAG: hypothetical protein A9Z00_00680 [Thermobacillus sp. ZCTH02-B1]|uniref:hypothetical protein n=1 Tax=Thermobacillus sp. ZCTH02-B1 TaxID=1858795 RepID=UPI000B55CC9A|nr:hypothetical protein [Thermobacillus sp. ZCTH02-B1]OUM94171.1 MAG: hypothetical protein A9Z00_00680 [Thermobacillus sp. ZCTH02-B1]
MSSSKVMKLITAILETILAIPVLGGLIVIGTLYWALGIMFILHLVTLILSVINKEKFYGSVVGLITSCLAWIPFLGWALHLVTAILLYITALKKEQKPHEVTQFPA